MAVFDEEFTFLLAIILAGRIPAIGRPGEFHDTPFATKSFAPSPVPYHTHHLRGTSVRRAQCAFAYGADRSMSGAYNMPYLEHQEDIAWKSL